MLQCGKDIRFDSTWAHAFLEDGAAGVPSSVRPLVVASSVCCLALTGASSGPSFCSASAVMVPGT